MNVYDFDKTIYKSDSTIDFYFFCLRKHPKIIRRLFCQGWGIVLRFFGKIDTTEMKSRFFSFLPLLPDVENLVEEFWDKNQKKIANWYLEKRKKDDLVISASPEFLLKPICKRLEIATPIATRVDIKTGRIEGKNCKGEEKLRRFLEAYPDVQIEEFYSDSKSDLPLACASKVAFLVKKNQMVSWEGG